MELENTRIALDMVLQMDVDYVEFDVQRCADDMFVLYHDDYLIIDGSKVPIDSVTFAEFSKYTDHYLRYDEVLAALKGKKKAHIDLKFISEKSHYREPSSTHEVMAARQAVDVLGAENVILTSLEDRSVRVLRDWADGAELDLLVGLSLGRDLEGSNVFEKFGTRLSELVPLRRLRRSRANLVVAHQKLAGLTVAQIAAWKSLPLLVWTVDDDAELRRWMSDPRVWMVTTNYPEDALRVAKDVSSES